MNLAADPFVALDTNADLPSPAEARSTPAWPSAFPPAIAEFRGFDIDERPLVSSLPTHPGQILAARTTVSLAVAAVGDEVLVVFAGGHDDLPIVVGVLDPESRGGAVVNPAAVRAQADGRRCVIEAEREIVLRCGDASITLTRAGKVLIEGRYVLSRSSGCNRIKGAAIDIN